MKLAFLAPEFLPPWGGVGVYSFELVRSLSGYKDMEIHVVTPVRGRRYASTEFGQFFGNNVHVHYISTANDTFFYNLKFQLAVLRNFEALNAKHHFDLVHSANLVHMPDIFLKFKKWKVPFVTTIHTTLDGQSRVNGHKSYHSNLASVELLSRVARPYIKFMERQYIKRTSNFICVSEWVRSLSGVDALVIHNGVDHRRFSPAKRKRQNRVPVVLYVGRLLAMKGIDCLIDALRPLLEEKRIRVVFAGEGNVEKYKRPLQGIDSSQYEFIGAVPYEDIHKLYQKADLFVLPSLTESFPLSVLEAMASGVAVVATKVGGIPEMVAHNENGLLVEPNNVEQLRGAVTKIIQSDSLKKRLEANARKLVEQKYTSALMARKTHDFYKEIMAEGCPQ